MRRGCVRCFLWMLMVIVLITPLAASAAVARPERVRVSLIQPSSAVRSLSLPERSPFSCSTSERLIWRGEAVGLTFTQVRGSYWQVSGTYSSYEEARTQGASRLGKALPWLPIYDGQWRLWLGDPLGGSISEAEATKAYPSLSLTWMAPASWGIYVQDEQGLAWLYLQPLPLQWQADNGLALTVAEKKHAYPGILEVGSEANGLSLVNSVALDDYVAGSVVKEMGSSWPLEALKAQAVAIRTLVMQKVGNAAAEKAYDVTDTELSYVGSDGLERGNVRRAVEETSGQILTYNSQPIQASFHADSGGHTQNSEDVWVSELPYLRGVKELFASESPDSSWSSGFTGEELRQLLIKAGHADPGEIKQVINEETTSFGAALSMRFIGSQGEVRLEMGKIRTALNLKSNNVMARPAAQTLVRSRLSLMPLSTATVHIASGNTITAEHELVSLQVRSATSQRGMTVSSADGQFVFSGGGWGHGVGMSQWGAKTMAEHGYDYKAILYHYYSGVTLE